VRLDHLLSKECHRLSFEPFVRGISPITTQLNTGYSAVFIYRQMMSAASFCLTSVRRGEPALHGPVPARPVGLSLFRFEGAALCGVSSLVMSSPAPAPGVRAGSRPSLARVELRVSSPGSGRRCRDAGRGSLTPCVPWSGCSSRLVPFGLFGRQVEMSDLACALCSPLRIPKRARASLFSKLQRANGGCLGA
jgi:hypothetical protein